MHQVNIYIIGIAGSGKTYLTKAFSEWLDFKKLDNIIVNLDPGAENLPYTPDIDIREWFTLEDIMLKYEVGPNGAQIIGADLISAEANKIKDEIDYHDAPYILIDTPGQMELFTLRQCSEILVTLLGRESSIMVFLFDPVISKTPSGFLSLLFMYTSAILKLNLPQISVLSKADVLNEIEIEKIVRWSSDPDELYDELTSQKTLNNELFHLLRNLGFFRPLIPVSALMNYGMDDIYDGIQEIFYGGDDLEKVLY